MTYINADTIRRLRERKHMTQKQLADTLALSDKTISKWETGRGLPDIAILAELAEALDVSVPELLTGEVAANNNVSANMRRSTFYVCPACGNIIHAMGAGAYSCCGIMLPELEEEQPDEAHAITTETDGPDLFITMSHPMTKSHYVSFVAYLTDDCVQMVRLYPEQNVEVRFRKRGHGRVLAYCNRHGLFGVRV